MGNQGLSKDYFNRGNQLFWILLIVLIVLGFLKLTFKIYNDEIIINKIVQIEKPLIVKPDSLIQIDSIYPPVGSDSILFVWKWMDYKNRWQSIQFRLSKSDLQKAENNRNSFNEPLGFIEDLWDKMYKFDRKKLKSLVLAYKKGISVNSYTGQEALDYVVSSIQFIGYTFVCAGREESRCGYGNIPKEDCRPLNTGGNFRTGCCDNVYPMAVFSPFEFAYNRTGDCDTKALFAYTILKELGYSNVSVIRGIVESGKHAMLGVKVPSPPFNAHYIFDDDGRKIYAWEVTSGKNKLGQFAWDTFEDWEVGIK